MSLEFDYPHLLLLFPLCGAAAFWLARRFRRAARGVKARVTECLRYVLIALCVLALAAPSVLIRSAARSVWFVLDASDSARDTQTAMLADLSAAFRALPDGQRAGVIAFGGDAMVELPLTDAPLLNALSTSVDASQSNLGTALQLAGALTPEETVGRVVVLSDGAVTDASAQASSLAARGVRVDYVRYEAPGGVDAQVSQVSLPATAYAGQSVTVSVTVDAVSAGEATLVLYQNRAVAATRQVTLRAGANTFAFTDVMREAGVTTYEARVSMPNDACAVNDVRGAYIAVSGAPRVLLVEGRTGEGDEVARMLRACAMRVDVYQGDRMPMSAEAYREWGTVLLVNVDYDAVDLACWQALDTAVRTLGRGLVVVGGDQSYALGGYRGSVLENMMPVTCDVKSALNLPSLALVLVIDKSGSMTEARYGISRLELAKEAAMRAAEVLTPKDEIGVIAFDDTCKWVVTLQKAEDVAAIQEMIGTIRAGGGTMFFTSLYEACRSLKASGAQQKHVIFLTDGDAADSGYDTVIADMRDNSITLTTVAVGEGANRTLLTRLAESGGGRAYRAGEFDHIPKIFTKETYLVSGSYVQNRVFTPIVTDQSALTNFSGFPTLSGYLAATEKELSTVSLVSDRDDPILASWQYGAGRVLAFTSDLSGGWSDDFLSWEDAASFTGGMVSDALPTGESAGDMSASVADGRVAVRYTMPVNAAQGDLDTEATVLAPDGTEQTTALEETAPGVYEGTVSLAGQGAYAVTVRQTDENGPVRMAEGGVTHHYSAEYDLRSGEANDALAKASSITSGTRLERLEDALIADESTAGARTPLRTPLLIALLILWVADIAQRRFPWEVALATRSPKPAREPAASRNVHVPRSKPTKPDAPAPAQAAEQLLAARRDHKKLL